MKKVFKLKIEPDDIIFIKGTGDLENYARSLSRTIKCIYPKARNPIVFLHKGVSIKTVSPELMEKYGWVRKGGSCV